MSVAVKAYLLKGEQATEEIRRFTITMKTPADFNSLKEKLFEVFPCLKSLNVSWRDDEGDMISMSSDAELWLALQAVKDNLLRIFVRENAKESKNKTDGTSNAEHTCICDGCDKGVVGFRFKCLVCPDYDLCSDCERTGMHNEHLMIRISSNMRGSEYSWLPHFHRATNYFSHRGRGWGRGCHGHQGWWNRSQDHWNKQQPEAPAEAQASAEGPKSQPPPPVNPKEILESIFAAFGAQPQAGGAEHFLRRVGETVAAVLDPLGIDVEVDVKPTEKPTKADKQGESKAPEPQSNATPGAPPPEMATRSPIIDSETGDWTYVDENEKGAEGVKKDSSVKPKGPPTTSLAEEMQKIDNIPLHPNPVIASALNQMLAMGFTNEGGWLTQLLEVKNGNLDSVLDVLHPVKPAK